MVNKLKLLIAGLFISSLSFAQFTGNLAGINGFGQVSTVGNGTNNQVLTMIGTNQFGWTSGGSAPTGSALFYNLSYLKKSPNNQQDTFLTPQYGGSGYKRNQANKNLVGNFYNVIHSQNAGVAAQVKWVFFGDSFSEIIYNAMLNIWQNMCGGMYSGVFGQGDGISVTPVANPGVTTTANRFKAWPSGITNYVTNNATWTLEVGGAAYTCNKITICYVKQSGGGTFEWKVTGGSFSSPISTSGTLGNLGIVEIKLPVSTYTLQILNSTGAKDSDEFAFIGFEDTAINGLTAIHAGVGGLQSDSCTNNITGVTNFQQFLYYEHPTVFSQEWKDDSLYFGATMDTIYNRLSYDTTLKHTDVIGIGSTPVGTTSGANLNQWVQNQQMQDKTLKYGFIYYDTYQFFGINPTQAFNNLQSLNWDSGGVHVNNTCNQYRGGRMLQDLGFFSGSESYMTNNVSNNTIKTNTLTVTVQGTGTSYGTITSSGTTDLKITSNKDLQVVVPKSRYMNVGYQVPPTGTNYTLNDTGTMYAGGTLTAAGGITAAGGTFSSQLNVNAPLVLNTGQYILATNNWAVNGSKVWGVYTNLSIVNQASQKPLFEWDSSGRNADYSLDTAQTITAGTIVVCKHGQVKMLEGAAASVQMTEPQTPIQNALWILSTTKTTVSTTWTNPSNFYATPPTAVTNVLARVFMYVGTKWVEFQ